jgi:[acyl-carrier-protein] S-malonyltransferase
MIAAGVDTFIEIGPGKTLTNMIRKISKDVKAVTVTEYLTEYPAEVKGC